MGEEGRSGTSRLTLIVTVMQFVSVKCIYMRCVDIFYVAAVNWTVREKG